MTMATTRLVSVLAFGVLSCRSLWAQAASTAQINGTVRDSSGLAVPAASIKVTQTATGAVRTVASGTDGSFCKSIATRQSMLP